MVHEDDDCIGGGLEKRLGALCGFQQFERLLHPVQTGCEVVLFFGCCGSHQPGFVQGLGGRLHAATCIAGICGYVAQHTHHAHPFGMDFLDALEKVFHFSRVALQVFGHRHQCTHHIRLQQLFEIL